jgi:hypothetical protein
VHPPVTSQLGMKGSGQHGPLPNRHDPTGGATGHRHVGHPGHYLDAGTGLLYPGGADEHGPDWATGYTHDVEIGLEGRNLPTECVTPHHCVHRRELSLIRPAIKDLSAQQDHPRARAVDRHPLSQPGAKWFHQIEDDQQTAHGGGLPARQDEGIHLGELPTTPHKPAAHLATGEGELMLPYITLQGKDSHERTVLGHIARVSCPVQLSRRT